MRTLRTRRAFTIIELVVVIVIIGILAAIAAIAFRAWVDHAHESAAIQVAEQVERAIQGKATVARVAPAPGQKLVFEPGGQDPVLDLDSAYPDVEGLPIKQVIVQANGELVVVTDDRRCVDVSFTAGEVASSAVGTWRCPLGGMEGANATPADPADPAATSTELTYITPANGGAEVVSNNGEDTISFTPGSDSVTVLPVWSGTETVPTEYTLDGSLPAGFFFSPATAGITGPGASEWGLKAKQVSAGDKHSCAVTSDNHVVCWGSNERGQLGVGTVSGNGSKMGAVLPAGVLTSTGGKFASVKEVVAGQDGSTCAVKTDGTVWCWGVSFLREADGSSIADSGYPIQVPGLSNVAHVSLSRGSACAVKTDGTVWCWGNTLSGDFGSESAVQQQADLPGAAVSVAVGLDDACAVLDDGTVWCWGNPNVPTAIYSATPAKVDDVNGATTVVGNDNAKTFCAIVTGGRVRCWGNDGGGLLGSESTLWGNSVSGVEVTKTDGNPLTGVVDVTINSSVACAVKSNGQGWCWGWDENGQRGDGAVDNASSAQWAPSQIAGTDTLTQISAGGGAYGHVCGLLEDSTIRCWGSYSYGEIGDGTQPGGTSALGETYPTYRENPAVVPVPTDVLTTLPRSLNVTWLAADGTVKTKSVNLTNALAELVSVIGFQAGEG